MGHGGNFRKRVDLYQKNKQLSPKVEWNLQIAEIDRIMVVMKKIKAYRNLGAWTSSRPTGTLLPRDHKVIHLNVPTWILQKLNI